MGFFEKIKDKIAGVPELEDDRVTDFRLQVQRAISDGVVTDDEIASLQAQIQGLGLTPREVSATMDAVYLQATTFHCLDRRITNDEYLRIQHIGQRLEVSQSAVSFAKQEVEYYFYLHAIETVPFDQLPRLQSTSLLLAKDENVYFSVIASMLEERVVRTEVRGRSSGVSFRIMKGVSYRVGQSRGEITSVRDVIPVSRGEFAITNLRLTFTGDHKSVNAPFSKIQSLELFSNGLRFSLTNRQKPVSIQWYIPEASEIIGLYLSRVVNQ